jgi:adenylate cyclase
MEPQALIDLLATFLAEMTNIILDSQGTLADYIRDAIFAFWGAPIDVKDPEIVLCETTLRQQERLRQLNADWAEQGLPQLRVRMGLHSGCVVCGNIGSELRMKYTAIGDAVNLASRLGK